MADTTVKKDNIPATVEAILDCLTEAHNIVSRMKPEPMEQGDAKATPAERSLERLVVQARDSANHLNRRLSEVADSVGML